MTKDAVYQIVTDRIIDLLNKGIVPWQKPWQGGQNMPRNLISKKEYRGINLFLLHASNHGSPFWLTYKQAKELGGNVKRGEHSMPVVFWKRFDVEDKAQPDGKRTIPMLRYYSVFNVDETEGISADKIPVMDKTTREHSPIAEAELIVKAMPKLPEIKHGQGQAAYSPVMDYVTMPNPEQFTSWQAYYNVLFHELTHATGHPSRLDRFDKAQASEQFSFGSHTYAKEELVAEMGAAFLSGHAGIVDRTLDNSAAYIASWLKRLKDDCKLVVQAAAQAQKSSDFILNKPAPTYTA